MDSITLLSELNCERISGGRGPWGDFISIRTKSLSTVDNNLVQTNNAYNLGGGSSGWYYPKGKGYGGLSSITNLQANAADFVSLVF